MKTQVREIDVLGVNGNPDEPEETYKVRVYFSFVEKESKTLLVPYPKWKEIMLAGLSARDTQQNVKNSIFFACLLAAHENDPEVFS